MRRFRQWVTGIALAASWLLTGWAFFTLSLADKKERKHLQVEDSLQRYIGKMYADPKLIVNKTMTVDNVRAYIRLKGIRWPNIVWAQSMVETGYLTCSNCCLQKNNLFGFMVGGVCMEFPDWQASVDYYARWQIKNMHAGEDYFAFLKRIGYAEFKDYRTHVAQILLDNNLTYSPD